MRERERGGETGREREAPVKDIEKCVYDERGAKREGEKNSCLIPVIETQEQLYNKQLHH